MLNGFNQPRPHGDHHWWQMIGTKGSVEWRRSGKEKPKLWLADTQMNDWMEVDWQYRRTDAPPEARGSGHGDADYYVHMYFRDAILKGEALDLRRVPGDGFDGAGGAGRGLDRGRQPGCEGSGLPAGCGPAFRSDAGGPGRDRRPYPRDEDAGEAVMARFDFRALWPGMVAAVALAGAPAGAQVSPEILALSPDVRGMDADAAAKWRVRRSA